MKFDEAVQKLKAGLKVTRNPWKDGLYFKMDGSEIKSFQPRLIAYLYDESIMISSGWMVLGLEGEYDFCDVIPLLQSGHHAKLKTWNDAFIFYDYSSQCLAYSSMEVFPYIPSFGDFTASDWIVLYEGRT